jgi:hypothetical protein
MWHPSYGEMAAQQLDEWRLDASRERLSCGQKALSPAPIASVRIKLGRTLVKLGERIAGTTARPAMR